MPDERRSRVFNLLKGDGIVGHIGIASFGLTRMFFVYGVTSLTIPRLYHFKVGL